MSAASIEHHFKKVTRFGSGPAFELAYALATLTDDSSRIHPQWKQRARGLLPASKRQLLDVAALGATPDNLEAMAGPPEPMLAHSSAKPSARI